MQATPLPRSAFQGMPLIAAAIGLGIFFIDTFTTLDIAIAVLYAVVILMAASVLRRRGIIVVATLCAALTVLGYLVSHGLTAGTALLRGVVSLFAIGIATFLALRNAASNAALMEQARLLDLTHDAILVRDMTDVITYWNRGAADLYGWGANEAVGKVTRQLLQTTFPEPIEEIFAKVVSTGRWEGELVHTKRDGSQVTVASGWSLRRGDSGEPPAVLESNTDITAQKRGEQEIRRARRNLQATIDTIPVTVASYLPDGTRDFVNRTWLEAAGISREDATQADWAEVLHPDDVEKAQRVWSDCLVSGQPFEMEFRVRQANGEYRCYLVRRVPLRDEQGEVIKWYSAGFDIEAQKRAEAALRRSEAYSAEAQRLSQTGSFGWRIDDGETIWSKETYRILGYDQTVKPSVESVLVRVHPDDLQMVQHQLDRANQDRNFDFEHRVVMSDGQVKDLHVRAQRMTFGTGRAEIVGAVMDITEAKRAQQALQTAQAELAHATRVTTLGEMTASIAHEVNQPLAGIVTNAEAAQRWLARRVPDMDETRQALERVIRDAERASGVVRRIRAIGEKIAPEMALIAINDVINDAMLLVQREVQSHQVALQLELGSGLPAVLGDRVQLQQVVINLVMNGMEAMAQVAAPQRRLRVRSEPHGDHQVLVTVQDAGVGISPEDANRLFSAFYTTKSNGMGMGLSVCRSIVEAHGGRIWATNNEGPGATVQFTLPEARAQP